MADGQDRTFRLLKSVVADQDPVPEAVLEAGRAAVEIRTIDAELADLCFDSLLDETVLVGVRSGASTRQLTFESAGRIVEVELSPAGRANGIVGQLIPAASGSVEVRHGSGSVTASTDELGRFSAPAFPVGPFSLRVDVDGEAPLVTDWIVT